MTKKAKKRPTTIGPKCSKATAEAIAACSDEQLREGCCYPAGSGAKVEWLRVRQERFGRHLTSRTKFAKSSGIDDNEMDKIFWGDGQDNPYVIPRPPSPGNAPADRLIITKHFAQLDD